jgi:Holliday junction resolvase-like predicted endonuclease
VFVAKQFFLELMRQTAKIGKLGEDIAAKYFAGLGYLILARNHREKMDEIDIIARRPDGTLIFCEVKTSSINSQWPNAFMPEDHLDARKLKKLIRGARTFVARRPNIFDDERGWQIDLIAISLKNEIFCDLNHYENI